jgi:hypothetical protein
VRAELLLAVLLAAPAAAAAEPPTLDVSVGAGTPRVGDRVPVMVTARGGGDLLWGELEVGLEPGGAWALLEGPRSLEGARPPAWELVLAPLETGELALPPIAASAREPGGEAHAVPAPDPPVVVVASVLPAGDEVEPQPLRDPVGVSGFPWEWVLPLAVPVLGAAAAFAWWSRRRRGVEAAGGVESLPPLDELERILAGLEHRLGREPVAGMCDGLAAGMRHYLARQSGEPAKDMTSFELRLLARRLGWSDGVQRGVQEVMAVADRVRFARATVEEARLRRTLETAREAAREIERHRAAAAAAAEEAASEAAG